MTHAMSQLKAAADAHMRRDVADKGKWLCACEDCVAVRSLVGMEKVLGVRPLVRELILIEKRLKPMPDSAEKSHLREHFYNLQDRLALEIAK